MNLRFTRIELEPDVRWCIDLRWNATIAGNRVPRSRGLLLWLISVYRDCIGVFCIYHLWRTLVTWAFKKNELVLFPMIILIVCECRVLTGKPPPSSLFLPIWHGFSSRSTPHIHHDSARRPGNSSASLSSCGREAPEPPLARYNTVEALPPLALYNTVDGKLRNLLWHCIIQWTGSSGTSSGIRRNLSCTICSISRGYAALSHESMVNLWLIYGQSMVNLWLIIGITI